MSEACPTEHQTSEDPAGSRANEARSARAGFILITGAKLWFLSCATVLNLGLPRFLGDAASFGDYGAVNSLISILNMVMVTGALQAVAKRVSERPAAAALVRRSALRLQAVLGGLLFVGLLALAGPLCEHLLKDASLAVYLRIAAVVTFSYAFYASLVGVMNGLKAFALQAMFDIAFASLKLVLIIGLVIAGFGVVGAFAGFAGAAVAVTLAALIATHRLLSRQPAVADPGPAPELLKFMLQTMGYVFFVNLLIQGDVLVVKRAALGPVLDALAGGVIPAWVHAVVADPTVGADALAREATSGLVGLFRATKNVSLIPYQAVIAITFVVFPLLSRATFETDVESTRVYVRQALRVALLLILALAAVLGSGGEALAGLLFGDAYRLAGSTLLPLIGAMSCVAMLYLVGSVLTASGRPLDALLLMAGIAAVDMVVLYAVIAGSVAGPELLWRGSMATFVCLLIGTAVSVGHLFRRLRVRLPWLTLARCLTGLGVALGTASQIGGEGIWAIFVRAALAGLAFLAVAVVTREITREDLAVVVDTFSRRQGSPR